MNMIAPHLNKLSTDVDFTTVSYQLPQLLVTLNNLIRQMPNKATSETAIYDYFTQVMTGRIRQAETAQIRAGKAPELADKKNRHQITFIENGLSIIKNADGTQTAEVKMAYSDYNMFKYPQSLLENVMYDFIMPQGIAKLKGKKLPDYISSTSKAVISKQYPYISKFYHKNKQPLTAITLLSPTMDVFQDNLQTWLEDTNQKYKSGGRKNKTATTTRPIPTTNKLFIGQLKTDKIIPIN